MKSEGGLPPGHRRDSPLSRGADSNGSRCKRTEDEKEKAADHPGPAPVCRTCRRAVLPVQILPASERRPDELRELVRSRGQDLQDVLRHLIIEGQATGEVTPGDPDQLVRAIVACVEGLTRWAAYHPEQYLETFPGAQIFLRMLKP